MLYGWNQEIFISHFSVSITIRTTLFPILPGLEGVLENKMLLQASSSGRFFWVCLTWSFGVFRLSLLLSEPTFLLQVTFLDQIFPSSFTYMKHDVHLRCDGGTWEGTKKEIGVPLWIFSVCKQTMFETMSKIFTILKRIFLYFVPKNESRTYMCTWCFLMLGTLPLKSKKWPSPYPLKILGAGKNPTP